jgi:phospholipid/cholesterol/gamma-HCH transport system ATP-binding protein
LQSDLTVLIISHDLTSLEHITDRVALLGEAKVLAEAPLAMLKTNPNPAIQAYFGIEKEGS